MQIETVNLSAMRPDPNNPRDDFGDIEALAESFAMNATNPGEPINPPAVVRDGNVFRIVDGERRYRAMKKAGKETCSAVVCEDMDEANVMVAMLVTDDKQQLTDIERSRGVQQMLILGVDEEKAEKIGHLSSGGGARVRRARKWLEDKADQMTLEHLVAIGEAEERGDEKAVKALAALGSHEKENNWNPTLKWEKAAEDYKTLSNVEAVRSKLVEKAQELGIDVLKKGPSDDGQHCHVKSLFLPQAQDEGIDRFLESAEPGCFIVCKVPTVKSHWIHAELYCPLGDVEETEEEAEARRLNEEVDRISAAHKEAQERRIIWVATQLIDLKTQKTLKSTLELFISDPYVDDCTIDDFAERAGVDADKIGRWTSPHLVARGWNDADSLTSWTIQDIVKGNIGSWELRRIVNHIQFMEALVADGYTMDDSEQELLALCREAHSEHEKKVGEVA